MVWTLQDAKNRFSELVERAKNEGPQRVTKYGEDAVVIVSMKQWTQLNATDLSLADFLLKSPLANTEIEFDRDNSKVRNIDL